MKHRQHTFHTRTGLLSLVACLLVLAPMSRISADPARGPSQWVNPALLNDPNYRPPADPESMSVIYGKRVNASVVSKPFHWGLESIDEVGRKVLRSIEARDEATLLELCVRDDEFLGIMWFEFPQSRPITGIRGEDAFWMLDAQNRGGIKRALDIWGGAPLQFARWERRDTVATYTNFNLHNGLVLIARDGDGREIPLDVVRAVGERQGLFRVYAMKD